MKKLFAALCLMTLAGCASVSESSGTAGATPENIAAWEKWKAEENAAWSTTAFAILKIEDAVYLKDGESAWLTTRKQKTLSHSWRLGRPRGGGHFVITYRQGKAEVLYRRRLRTFKLKEAQTVPLRHGIDVRFALTQISPGVNGLRIMVYNQANAEARAFNGLSYFDFNPAAIVEARVEAAPSAEAVDFQTSRGWLKRFNRVATAHFTIEGQQANLGLYSDETDPAKITTVSAFFLDTLSGSETYGVGRYMDIDVKGLPDHLTLDFNRAYNPNCARSPHYNCPLATDHIPVALRAGEKIPPKH